jgi:hypothetical protein
MLAAWMLSACGGPTSEPLPTSVANPPGVSIVAAPATTPVTPAAPHATSAAAATPDAPLCEPLVRCGCFVGCEQFVALPAEPGVLTLARTGGQRFRRSPSQPGGAEICDASGRCVGPLEVPGETCTDRCAPAPAPFRCRYTPAGACDRLELGMHWGDPLTEGDGSTDGVARVLAARSATLARCFVRGPTVEDGFLRLAIRADGTLDRVQTSEMPERISTCLRREARRVLRFPPGETMIVQVPLRYIAH